MADTDRTKMNGMIVVICSAEREVVWITQQAVGCEPMGSEGSPTAKAAAGETCAG
jgi:hypothetical protein